MTNDPFVEGHMIRCRPVKAGLAGNEGILT
jgi:hypothetical protein